MTDSLEQDLRHASRALWRAKASSAATALILALGIAGTTLMFALTQGVLLRPLPVRDQDRLIVAWKEAPASGSARYPFGNTEIEEVAEASRLLEAAAGVTRNGVGRTVLTDAGDSSYVNVGLVTGGFFEVLGVPAMLGRALAAVDDQPGAEGVVVITTGFWRRHYGGAPQVIGRRVTLGEQRFTIVGVMPPDLDYPAGVEIWQPTSTVATTGPFGDAARREVNLIGRLRPGVTLAQATSEIAALSRQVDAGAPPNAIRGLAPVVRPFADLVVGDIRLTMLALFGAVGLVLLIGCANVANLLLMRGEARRSELALRAALGAGRGRIVRQMFAESVVLSAIAGLAGVWLAWASLEAVVTLVPDGLPRVESIRIDRTVVLFSLTMALLTALLAGLAPALLSLRGDLVSPLRRGWPSIAAGTTARGRRSLVVAQAALAVTVLAAAGLLIRSLLALQAVDLGLSADRLVLLDLHLPRAKYSERQRHERFLDEAMTALRGMPGTLAVTPVNVSPFTGRGWDVPRLTAEGQDAGEAVSNPSLGLESIHPSYFDTFAVPIVRGRAFTAADREGAPEVAIVSEDAAARIWPQGDAIGRRVKMGSADSPGRWYTVVGVAAPTRYRTLLNPFPTLYLPAAQFQMTALLLAVRTTAPIEQLAPLAGDRIREVDADARVVRAAPFADLLARPLARPRFTAWVIGLFGLAALLLSTVGLYAVMAASVRQRDRELAVRLALGATTAAVRRTVVVEAGRLAALGVLGGVGGALAATRLLRGMLFEIHPLDPPALAGAGLLLILAAAIASYGPVRRATRADLVTLLRSP